MVGGSLILVHSLYTENFPDAVEPFPFAQVRHMFDNSRRLACMCVGVYVCLSMSVNKLMLVCMPREHWVYPVAYRVCAPSYESARKLKIARVVYGYVYGFQDFSLFLFQKYVRLHKTTT